MAEENIKYKFENLQPINFLKRFNKMVDDDQKNPVTQRGKELKVFPLTKFPLPEFYKNMEGIFETGIKKKDISSVNTKNKQDIQQQEFSEKHQAFMTKHIQKIIQENEAFQEKLQYEKVRMKKEMDIEKRQSYALQRMKMRSEPKLKKVATLNKIKKLTTAHTQLQSLQHRMRAVEQNIDNVQKDGNSDDETQNMTYFQKLQKKRMENFNNKKKDKARLKNKKEINHYLQTRKDFVSEHKRDEFQRNSPFDFNQMHGENKKDYIDRLLALQRQQSEYQKKFDKKVETNINQFSQTVNQSIKKVRSEKYW